MAKLTKCFYCKKEKNCKIKEHYGVFYQFTRKSKKVYLCKKCSKKENED